MQELGHGCIFLVQKAGALQICPTDSYTKRELIECARAVTEKVRPSLHVAPWCLSTELPQGVSQSNGLCSGIFLFFFKLPIIVQCWLNYTKFLLFFQVFRAIHVVD